MALLLAVLVLVGGQFILMYLRNPTSSPVGFDTPKYIWRANLVAAEGLEALPRSGTEWFKHNADRPGHPILSAVILSITRIDAFDLAFVLPASMATLIGLGAGAFAVRALREPWWAFPVYAVAAGVSVNVGLTAVGLADNLVVDALLMAAAVCALLVAGAERGAATSLLLLTGAAVVHWPFALVFLLMLGGLAVLLLPESFLAWRRGASPWATPSVRLGILVAASGMAMGAAVALAPAPPDTPRAGRGQFVRKLRAVLPLFRLPILGTAAAAGALALLLSPDRERRRALLMAAIWALSAAAAAALLALGAKVPAHRMIGFALGIPLLGAAALVAAARLLARRSRLLVPIAVILVVGGLVWSSSLTHAAWGRRDRSWMKEGQLVAARQAGAYLEEVAPHGPVVFVINPLARQPGSPVELSFRVIRAALPGSEVLDTYVYLGRAEELLAGRPTLRPTNPDFNKVSLRHWRDVRSVLHRDPVFLLLPPFNQGLPEHRQTVGEALSPELIVLRGPVPAEWRPPPAEAPGPPSAARLAAHLALVLGLLWVVGAGWAVSLLPGEWLVRAALAPALGLAAVVCGGLLAGRLGVDGLETAGVALAALLAALGWAPVAASWGRSRWTRVPS